MGTKRLLFSDYISFNTTYLAMSEFFIPRIITGELTELNLRDSKAVIIIIELQSLKDIWEKHTSFTNINLHISFACFVMFL